MRQVVFIPFVLISASKNGLTVNENHKRSTEAQTFLREHNADFANVVRKVNGRHENSFMIFGEKAINAASKLAEIFGQDNYIVRDQSNEAYLVNLTGDKEFLGVPKELTDEIVLDGFILPQLDGSSKQITFIKEH